MPSSMARHAESRFAATAAARACRGGGRPGGAGWSRPRSCCCTRPATSPTRTSVHRSRPRPPPRRRTAAQAGPSGRQLPVAAGTATTPGGRACFDGPGRPAPAAARRLELLRRRAARVPAGDLPRDAVLDRRRRLGQGVNTRSTGTSSGTRKIGTLSAASPAIAAKPDLVLMPVLSVNGHSPGRRAVRRAVDEAPAGSSGRARSPAGSESSPIVCGRTVYFGDQGGTLYSLNAANGHRDWTYHASGAIKGGPALVGRRSSTSATTPGRAYARQRASAATRSGRSAPTGPTSGSARATSTRRRRSPSGACTWATPTAACTRSAARNGALAWATGTGAYVYASAAVADPPGLGPTVYVGSYDGNFYAFNAQSGAVRWSHPAGGGSPARRRSSATSSTTRTSARRRRRASTPHRPAGVLVPRRRVHPGDRRLPTRSSSSATATDLPAAPGRPAAEPAPPQRTRRKPRPPSTEAPHAASRSQGDAAGQARRAAAAPTPRRRPQDASRRCASAQRTPSSQRNRNRCTKRNSRPRNARSGRSAIILASMRCRSGSHCQQPAEKGRRFCADHAAELDRMREELKDAAAARIGRGRPKRSSTCCRPGCYEPRVPPAAYCDTCSAAGYVEEAA